MQTGVSKTCYTCGVAAAAHGIIESPCACDTCENYCNWVDIPVASDDRVERRIMAETISKDQKIFADKIRMIAKSIYESADDIAGNTEGCVDISISFTIETNGVDASIPTYDVMRTHYPKRKLLEDYIFGKGGEE